jgi:hypothetical protein
MRIQVRLTALASALAAAAFSFPAGLQAQNVAKPASTNGSYIAIDPLAGVSYDNRYDLSAGLAYRAMKAGPDLNDYGQLGGLDISGSYRLKPRLRLEATARGYLGTDEGAPNAYGLKGQFIQNYIFAAGPEFLGPHNKHAALVAHGLFGGVYGKFEGDLHGKPPAVIDFYNDQFAPAAIVGGHIDLNRSARWVFRITPDAVFTWFKQEGPVVHNGVTYTDKRYMDVNFALSVGVAYKFNRWRR